MHPQRAPMAHLSAAYAAGSPVGLQRRRASGERGSPTARAADDATRTAAPFLVGRCRCLPRRPTSRPRLCGEVQNLWTRVIQEATTLRLR